MHKSTQFLPLTLAFLSAISLAGCTAAVSRTPATISLNAGRVQAIDQGQTITITATLSNDAANKGVSWSLSGVGSLSNQTTLSVTYNAPASVSSTTTTVITATSVASANVTAKIAITVNPAPKVSTNVLPAGTVGTAYSFTLQASGGTDGYTWNVSGGALPAWAALSSTSGTLSGTPNLTGTSNFSITVTDSAGLTSAGQALSLIVGPLPPLVISTTLLPNASIGIPYSTTLLATGGLPPYTWSVASGSLPSWASLASSTGVLSGTPAASGTSSFTVRVTDSETPRVSTTQALSLTAVVSPNNAELSGQYAFRLQGFDDATGNQFAVVGSFIADGKGGITNGIEDINGPGGYQGAVSFTGTYNIGTDDRGFATFENSLNQSTAFALAVGSLNQSNVAREASLIEFDDRSGTIGKRGTGGAYLQDPNAFSLSSISGPYAFQFVGQAKQPGARRVLIGALTSDGKGSITTGEVRANTNGVIGSEVFTGTFSTTAETAASGRVMNSSTGTVMPNLAVYIVSASRALAMSVEAESTSGLLGGEFLAQTSTTFTAASLHGLSVGYGVGTLAISSGLWTFDGSAIAAFSLVWSNAQSIYPLPQSGSLTYSVSANGRVTTSGGSLAPGVPGAPIFYLVGNNKGFLMSTDNSASAGFFEPQAAGPFSSSSISGNYFLGTVTPALTGWSVATGVGTSSGNGTLNLTFDVSDPIDLLSAGQDSPLNLKIDANGWGLDFENPFVPRAIVCLVSPDKAVLMMNTIDWPRIMIFQR